MSACRCRWGRAGFVTVAACRRSVSVRRRAATCRSPSARRSRCCGPRSAGCGRSPAGSAGRRRRSRGAAAQRGDPWRQAGLSGLGRAVAGRAAAQRPKTAKLADERPAARVRAGPARRHGHALRTARDPGPGDRWMGRSKPPRRTGAGRRPGARSRSPTGSRSTSPMMSRCGSRHEAIYQALYIQGRGALRRELTACLRTGRALRVPRPGRRGGARSSSPRTS